MAITLLPPVPTRTDDPDTFIAKTDVFLPALNTFANEANELAANLNSIAAGGAFAYSYRFDTSTALADPGSGKLRASATSLTFATSLRISNTDLAAISRTAEFNAAFSAGSTVRATIKIVKLTDPTKFVVYNVTGLTAGATFTTLNVAAVVTAGGTAPFALNDTLSVQVQRTGDIGPPGTLQRRTVSTASVATATPVITSTDLFVITSLATNLVIAAPTGTPTDGQGLMLRIKDNGTARTLAYDTVYRASSEAPFPSTTTPGKFVYMGFIYNEASAKWDMVALLNNM